MDVHFVNQVIKSTVELLSGMAKQDVKHGQIRAKNRDEPVSGKCVTGLMDIVSEDSNASIALIFTEAAILDIHNSMMPQVKHSIDGMVIDLAGELANMVMGLAKGKLEGDEYLFKMSLPTMICGSDYLVAHKTKAPILVVPFTTHAGKFFIEATFDKRKT